MASKSKTYELALKIAGKVDSSLKAACTEADKNLTALGTSAKKAGKVAATAFAAVGTAAVAAATSSLSVYSEFEQAMANTAAIAGATGDDYEALEAAAREMGAATTKTATEAAEALGYMALAGWNAQESIAGLEPVLRLSEATQMDLATCSDLVTDSMSALGLSVEDLEGYLDLCVQTNNKANTTAESLMEAFIGCGGAAKTTGVDMNDLATALGILANNGTKGSEAGTALNAMLVRMTSKDAAISAMDALGVSVFDVAGEFRGLETVMGDLSAAMADLSTEEKAAYMASIAGTNYYTEMSYLLDAVADGADGAASAWSTLEGQLEGSDGALMTMAGQITDTLNSATEIFKSAVQEAQLTIGEQIAPYAQEGLEYLANEILPQVTEMLGDLIPKLIDGAKWAWENKEAILTIAGAVAGLVATYKTAKTIVTAYNAVMSLHKVITAASTAATAAGTAATTGATVATTALSVATNSLLWPILAVMAAIAALIAIIVLCVKHWDKIKAAASAVWNWIKNIWSTVADWFNANVIQPIVNFFSPIVETISGIFQGLWIIIQAVWKVVSDWFNANVIQPLIGFFAPIIETIGGFFSGLWEQIVGVWNAAGAWFSEHVAEPIKEAFQVVSDFAKGIFNGLIGIVEGLINRVISGINGLIGGFSNVVGKAASFLGIDWGGIAELPTVTLPRLAAGGIATAPTLAQIGEGGEPEAVLPLSKLAALLDEWTKPKPGGGGTGGGGETVVFSPVFNFYGGTPSREEAEEAGRVSFAEFKRLYKQMKAEEKRKQFSPA